MKCIAFFLLIVTSLFSSCQKAQDVKPGVVDERDYQVLAGDWSSERTYRNSYFGFKMEVSKGWDIDRESHEKIIERAEQLSKSSLKEDFVIIPFSLSRTPADQGQKSTVNLVMQIKQKPKGAAITTGEDILKGYKIELAGIPNIVFEGSPIEEHLRGARFWTQTLSLIEGDRVSKQKAYAVYKDDFFLLIGIGYNEGEGNAQAILLEKCISGL